MSKIDLSGWDAGVYRIRNRVIDGVERTAADVQRMATQRAPVRKAFKTNRTATKHDLESFSQKIKGGDDFTGDDIREAASLVGIDLNVSQAKAIANGRRLTVAQGSGQLGHGVGINRGSSSLGMKHRQNTRILRTIGGDRVLGTPVMRRGKVEFNAKRRAFVAGRSTARKLTARAKYDIRHGHGVILAGHGHGQYGGYLRKHIELIAINVEGDHIVYRVTSKAPYSRYVEFPTSRTAAQPFLLPAFKAARGRLARNIKTAGGKR